VKFVRSQSLKGGVGRLLVFGLARAQVSPAARLNRCFSRSPIDALIDLVVRCRLPRQIPVWFELGTLTHLRITVLPQRRAARREYAGRLRLHPDVLEHLPDIGVVRDERDDAHLLDVQLDVLVQGQFSKRKLVERFRVDDSQDGKGCVLVASASFWEGIDILGEALHLVIIDKLPFPGQAIRWRRGCKRPRNFNQRWRA
jgi:hypothetical protein